MQQLLNGIMLGSVYSIVALGLTLVYGTLHIPNFAHGNFFMFGAYLTFVLVSIYGINYWVAILGAAAMLGIMGAASERVFRPLRGTPEVNYFIAAIGLLMVLEGSAHLVFGPDSRQFPPINNDLIQLMGATITLQRLIVIGSTVLLIIGLHIFMKKTVLGATIEALAQDREGALLVGINVNRTSIFTFALATALAACAAGLIAPISWVYPTMGHAVNLKAFVIVIIGGMGSIPGAVISGYLLGVFETMVAGYVSANYEPLFAFGALVVVLAIKPTGLFGRSS